MKTLITTLLMAASCGSLSMALDATNAQVTLPKLASLEFKPISPSTDINYETKSKKKLKRELKHGWHYASVPIKVEGKAKGGKTPDYVPALNVTFYVLVSMGRDEKPAMLKKELKYIDVPVGTVNVGGFITPSDVSKLSASATKPDKGGDGNLEGKIIGVAVTATFDGENCMKTGEPNAYIFDTAMEKKLSSKWWTSSLTSKGITLRAINETPFAPFYDEHFPMLDQIYSTTFKKASGGDSDSEDSTESEED